MIPQILGDDIVVEIEYDVVTDGVTTTNKFVGDNAKKLNSVTGTTITAWNKNQKINYTFVVGLKPIEFTASVTDWADADEGTLTF